MLAAGQCNPGTWGHRVVPDFIPPGYGSLNSVRRGLLPLAGARQNSAASRSTDRALRNSIGFYGSYAGRGGIPYGDHPPTYNASSNGKNGMAAVAFHMLGAGPAAQWFARLCLQLEPPRPSRAGTPATSSTRPGRRSAPAWRDATTTSDFWSRFNSYRDLARRRDGSFMTQPFPHKREGDLGTGNYVSKGPMWTTGGFALSYLAATGRLAVLGRTDSVFGADTPRELKSALDLYERKQFAPCAEAADTLTASSDPRSPEWPSSFRPSRKETSPASISRSPTWLATWKRVISTP